MSATLMWLAGLTLGAFIYVLLRKWATRAGSSRKYPPGPATSWTGMGLKGIDMPKQYPWLTYAKWKETYGDIIFLNVFRNPLLVLNSAEAAQDLLEKRSAIYSSRPVRTMQADLMGFGFLFSGLPYNSWYKQHRTMFHKYFQAKTVSDYHAIQLKHTHILLRNLQHDWARLDHHIRRQVLELYLFNSQVELRRRTTAAIVLEICYGHHVAEQGDEYVSLADQALTGIAQSGNFGTYMVDYIPILKYVPEWMPGAEFKRKARQWKVHAVRMLNTPFDMVKKRLELGTAEACITTTELEAWFRDGPEKDMERQTVIKDVAATAYAAGSDTTLSTLVTFFLVMVLHPEVQEKLRRELQQIVHAGDRLPTFKDRDEGKLPYLECVVWECLRWRPAVNLSLAHYIDERDDEYRNYSIPKGTTVLGNIWAITHDPQVFPDPDAFNPDRFLDRKRNDDLGINPVPETVFGFGRRICPGRFLAIDTIWIVIASVISVYKLSKLTNENGEEVEPKVEYSSGLFSRPRPFDFKMEPLSDKAAMLISQTASEL
ncbi:hypothetical protein ONZ45_g5071 [Pleurotus djamor]|nr:hypothetical protein ONZ45_g5071 [Pleurotus djamor]